MIGTDDFMDTPLARGLEHNAERSKVGDLREHHRASCPAASGEWKLWDVSPSNE